MLHIQLWHNGLSLIGLAMEAALYEITAIRKLSFATLRLPIPEDIAVLNSCNQLE